MDEQNVVEFLENEFNRRKSINPNYSLRAYAKNLCISPAVLSQVLNRKKDLTPKVLRMIAPKLNLQDDFLDQYLKNLQKIKKEKNIKSVEKSAMRKLDMETFNVISEWYHYVILEMFYLDDFTYDISWIATKLKLEKETVESAIQNLLNVRLLKIEEGVVVPTDDYTLIDEYHFTSQAMRERQKQILKISALKMDEISANVRDHSSITISVDPELIPEIKEKIKVFRRSLANYIAKNSERSTSVYEIQIGFFPVTEI